MDGDAARTWIKEEVQKATEKSCGWCERSELIKPGSLLGAADTAPLKSQTSRPIAIGIGTHPRAKTFGPSRNLKGNKPGHFAATDLTTTGKRL